MGLWIYKIVNHIILIIGIALSVLLGILDTSHEGNIEAIIPVIYFMIQMFPIILMEIFGFKYFKLMRKADKRTLRKAELMPRRLFDFVSPKILILAIVMYIACLLFYNSIAPFHFNLGNDTFIIFITLTASNLFFAGIIYWNIYGKKLDPYQAGKDRFKQIETTVKSLLYMSIAACIFLITIKAIDEYQFDFLEAPLMSLYMQFIALLGLGSLLRNIKIEELDFDVYKSDESMKPGK